MIILLFYKFFTWFLQARKNGLGRLCWTPLVNLVNIPEIQKGLKKCCYGWVASLWLCSVNVLSLLALGTSLFICFKISILHSKFYHLLLLTFCHSGNVSLLQLCLSELYLSSFLHHPNFYSSIRWNSLFLLMLHLPKLFAAGLTQPLVFIPYSVSLLYCQY